MSSLVPNDAPAALRLSLVVPSRTDSPYVRALAATLTKVGSQVTLVTDGDPAMLRSDGIILTGYLPRLHRTAALLCAGPRPPVLAWVYEPLVPDDMAPWAAGIARRLSRFPGQSWGRMGLRLARLAFVPIARFGMGRWTAASSAKEVQFAFGYTDWLRRMMDAGGIDLAATSTVQKGEVVQGWGHNWLFAPLSFDWTCDLPQVPGTARDVDVLFLGRLSNAHRRRLLRTVLRPLKRAGLRVEVASHGLYGAARATMLDRTKVVMNLSKYPWDTAWMRFYMAAAQGVAVVSEPLSQPAPLRPGLDYLEASPDRLAETIVSLIADEPRRAALVTACRARIDAEMSFDDGARRMIAAVGLLQDKGSLNVR